MSRGFVGRGAVPRGHTGLAARGSRDGGRNRRAVARSSKYDRSKYVDERNEPKVIAAVQERPQRSTYLEPFVNSIVIGASAGGIVEAVHALSTLANSWYFEAQATQLASTLPALWQQQGLLWSEALSRGLPLLHGPRAASFFVFYTMSVSHATFVASYGLKAARIAGERRKGAGSLEADKRGEEEQGGRRRREGKEFGQLWPFGEPAPKLGYPAVALAPAPPASLPDTPTEAPASSPRGPAWSAPSKKELDRRQRKGFLKNFWYAASTSEELKDKPVGVEIIGRKLVLFRDEKGAAACMPDACPHRGAPLSLGWTEQDNCGRQCVVCPYHGWAFDSGATVRSIPANDVNDPLPSSPLMRTYPTEERGGLVWVFVGDRDFPWNERPPVPIVDEMSQEGWKVVHAEIEFDAPHMSVFENSIDFAHIHFLHGSSFGNSDKPEIKDWRIEQRDMFGFQASLTVHNKPVSPVWEWTSTPQVKVVAQTFLPYTSAIQIFLGAGVSMIVYVNTVPVNEGKTINRLALIRNFAASDLFDRYAAKQMLAIQLEDKAMVEQLRVDDLDREHSVRADLLQVKCRGLIREWMELGYGEETH